VIDDPRGSFGFDPVRVAPPRRRFDPVLLGVIAVVVALGFAIVKPWEWRPDPAPTSRTAPVAVGSASPSEQASPSNPDGTPTYNALVDPAQVADTLATFQTDVDWGVGAISQVGTTGTFIDTWSPAEFELPGNPRTAAIRALPPVVVLSVTTPSAEMPLDARIFRRQADGTFLWIDAEPVSAARPDAALLFMAPRPAAGQTAPWPTGHYRVELLFGQRIERIDLQLADQDDVVGPDPSPTFAGVTPPAPIFTDTLPVGPFAVIDGVALPVSAGARAAELSPLRTWLDLPAPDDPMFTPRVGRVSALGAPISQLGIALPGGSSKISVSVDRIDPDPAQLAIPFDFVGESDRSDTPPYLVLDPPVGSAWLPGVYGLHVGWTDRTGARKVVWEVEVRPFGQGDDPVFLAAARAFSSFAGGDGLIEGSRAGIGGRPSPGAIRLFPFVRNPKHRGAIAPVGCALRPIDRELTVIGISRAHGDRGLVVMATTRSADGLTTDVPLRSADLDGLTIVGPANDEGFAPGVYDLTLDDGKTTSTVSVCLGTTPLEG
jgi:hypothetical protein